jgi:hypothetical protein
LNRVEKTKQAQESTTSQTKKPETKEPPKSAFSLTGSNKKVFFLHFNRR